MTDLGLIGRKKYSRLYGGYWIVSRYTASVYFASDVNLLLHEGCH